MTTSRSFQPMPSHDQIWTKGEEEKEQFRRMMASRFAIKSKPIASEPRGFRNESIRDWEFDQLRSGLPPQEDYEEQSQYQLTAGRNRQGPVGLPLPVRPQTRHSSRRTPGPEERSRPSHLSNSAIQYDLQKRPATANSHRAERPAIIRATTGSFHGSRTPTIASIQQSSQEVRRRSSPADYRRYELEQRKASQPRARPLSLYAVPDPPQIPFHKYPPRPESRSHFNGGQTPPMALSPSMDAGRHYFRDQEPEARSYRASQFPQPLRVDWLTEANVNRNRNRDFDREMEEDNESISSIDPMVPDCQLQNSGPPRWI